MTTVTSGLRRENAKILQALAGSAPVVSNSPAAASSSLFPISPIRSPGSNVVSGSGLSCTSPRCRRATTDAPVRDRNRLDPSVVPARGLGLRYGVPDDVDTTDGGEELIEDAHRLGGLVVVVEASLVCIATDGIDIRAELAHRVVELEQRVSNDLESALQFRVDHMPGTQIVKALHSSKSPARATIARAGATSWAAATTNSVEV